MDIDEASLLILRLVSSSESSEEMTIESKVSTNIEIYKNALQLLSKIEEERLVDCGPDDPGCKRTRAQLMEILKISVSDKSFQTLSIKEKQSTIWKYIDEVYKHSGELG